MSCFVPEKFRDQRWHVIRPTDIKGVPQKHFEIAEWINDVDGNGPIERGHWLRWGYCGDFPSLCQATYIGPFPDQEMLSNASRPPS